MSVPATTFFNIQKLRRFDGPQYFLAGGFLAGLLVFAVWMARLPDHGQHGVHARGNGVAGSSEMAEPGSSVLDDITGGARGPGDASGSRGDTDVPGEVDADIDAEANAEAGAESALAPDPAFDQAAIQDANAMAVGEDVGSQPRPEEGALTDSLLDAPPPASEARAEPVAPPGANIAAPLRSWFVEVEVAPGQVQMLQLNAESPEHALAILRDFRGNPRVLRGPSAEPLP